MRRRHRQGGVAGFADPHLARALAAFHRRPAAEWSVAALAREAGLSRTGFAERFTAMLGVTPMAYITAWRMQIAREALTAAAKPSKEEAWAEADRLRTKIGKVSGDSTQIIREWRHNDERYR